MNFRMYWLSVNERASKLHCDQDKKREATIINWGIKKLNWDVGLTSL